MPVPATHNPLISANSGHERGLRGEASVRSVIPLSRPWACLDRQGGPGSWWVILLLALALAMPAAAAQPEVTALRFGFDAPRTRIVLEADQPLTYTVRTLAAPNRLVVELGGVAWRLQDVPGRPRGLVQGHQLETGKDGHLRLVVGMAKPFRVLGSIVLPPSKVNARFRLVIDAVPGAAAAGAPVAEAALPEAATERAEAAADPPLPEVKPSTARPDDAPPAARPEAELPVIVIDPGHGGVDPGAIAVNRTFEKNIVLEMGLDLRRLIEATGRYQVALTRDSDVFIPLRDRISLARELHGQVFISIHADSIRSADQRGASVYTLSETASDAEAERLASSENKADILAGTDLSQHDAMVATILLDLAQRDTNNRSITFADLLAEELEAVTPMLRKHRRFAGFAVLKSPDIPSVLLELGYLSNADDARNLAQADYRAKLSKAIVRALDRFFALPRS